MMRLAVVLCVCFTTVLGRSVDLQWQQYKNEYGKLYSENEEELRRNIFGDNLRAVEKHNAGHHSFRLGLTKFADMTNEEYKKQLRQQKSTPLLGSQHRNMTKRSVGDIPDSVDWRTSGFVGPVRDQGPMGNAVVMAVVDAVQGGERKFLKSLVSLSTQQLLECCGTDPCQNSCQFAGECMLCLTELVGLDSEATYPSTQCKSCGFQMKDASVAVIGYLRDLGSEVVMKADVASVGPGVVAVDASNLSFQLYNGGIYDEPNCSSTVLDHVMVVVGYGTENGQDFWIVRNSWGSSWGEEGYIRMSRNKSNQCGIASDVWFPIVSGAP